jgi:hypothetical protein
MVQGGKYVCGSLVGNNSNRLELVSTELQLPFAGSANVEVMCYCTEKCTTHHTACPFIHRLQYCDLKQSSHSHGPGGVNQPILVLFGGVHPLSYAAILTDGYPITTGCV